MPANIAKINGKDAVALAREPAWHGLGTVVDHLMKAEEAFKEAQLDWTVEKRQLFNRTIAVAAAEGEAQLADTYDAVDAYGIFRSLDGALLGTCGKMYKPIQNIQGFELIDALLELSDGGAYYETAGALGQGEIVWALARIPEQFRILGGEEHKLFLMFMTRHDGNGSARCKLVDTRVVCQNTLSVAIGEHGGEVRIAHFGDVESKIAAAKKLMAATGETVRALEAKLNLLATREVTKDLFFATMNELFPADEEKLAAGVEEKARLIKIAEIAELYAENDGNANPLIKGTALNLLNAITQYTDHVIGTDKTRARSAMFGNGDLLKNTALDIILEVTAAATLRTEATEGEATS
jgi:phage/plasmid-like protein (TIGR03299 family)